MGLQHYHLRPRVALDQQTPPGSFTPSAPISHTFQVCRDISSKRLHRKSTLDQAAKQTLYGTEKGLFRETSHPRPIAPEQVHQVRQIQNVDCRTSSSHATSKRLGMLSRPPGRLLACSHSSPFSTFSRLSSRFGQVLLQSSPIWDEHSTEGVHKVGQHHRKQPSPPRYKCGSVSGRLASMGRLKRKVRFSSPQNAPGTRKKRLHSEHQEISPQTPAKLPVAGYSVGHNLSPSISPSLSSGKHSIGTKFLSESASGLQTGLRKDPGSTPILFHSRSMVKSGAQRCREVLENVCLQSETRSETSDTQTATVSPVSVAKTTHTQHVRPTGPPTSIPHDTLRRFSMGLGRTHRQQDSFGQMVLHDDSLSHQFPGTASRVSQSSQIQSTETLTHPSSHGQHHSSGLSEKRRLPITNFERSDETVHKATNQEEMVSVSKSPIRDSECSGRLTIQAKAGVHRMDSGQVIVPHHQPAAASSGSRPVCNQAQSSASTLCVPSYGPKIGGSRRISVGLEHLENSVSVSPSPYDFEGFTPSDRVPRHSLFRSTTLAFQSLVPSTQSTVQSCFSSEVSTAVPDSEEQEMFRILFTEPRPSRVDFIKRCYSRRYSPAVTSLLVQKLRRSTINQYESTWKLFLDFLRQEKPSELTDGIVLDFFTQQFIQKGRKPATIRTYKSALDKPLRLGFNIILHENDFSDIVRAMALLAPAEISPTISWSLNRVLALLSSPEYSDQDASEDNLLAKAVFLLSLACGSRVSEISALMRDKSHITQKDSGHLLLFPSRHFLAKNEDPMKRRPPIQLWNLDDNPLCPVSALLRYLAVTNRCQHGALFIKPGTCNPLSIKSLTQKMVALIKIANPDSFPHFHDIRKYATTLAFLGDATIEELERCTGWRSIQVFLRHYLKRVEELRFPIQSAGIILPSTSHG